MSKKKYKRTVKNAYVNECAEIVEKMMQGYADQGYHSLLLCARLEAADALMTFSGDVFFFGVPVFVAGKPPEPGDVVGTVIAIGSTTEQVQFALDEAIQLFEPKVQATLKVKSFTAGWTKSLCCETPQPVVRKIIAENGFEVYLAYSEEEAAELEATGAVKDYKPSDPDLN